MTGNSHSRKLYGKSPFEWPFSRLWVIFYLLLFLLIFYIFIPHWSVIYSFYILLLVLLVSLLYTFYPEPIQLNAEWIDERITAGEEAGLKIKLYNRTPLPWTRVIIILSTTEPSGRRDFFQQTFLKPFGSQNMDLYIQLPQRGVYPLPGTKLIISDLFGLSPISREWQNSGELVVYPPIPDWHINYSSLKNLSGRLRTNSISGEESVNPISLRSYAPGDPMGRIDWKATARLGTLMVKEFEYTATDSIYILPDLKARKIKTSRKINVPGIGDLPIDEAIISYTAALTSVAIKNQVAVKLLLNQKDNHRLALHRTGEITYIMEQLAYLNLNEQPSAPELLRHYMPSLSPMFTLIIITPAPHRAELENELFKARKKGFTIRLLQLSANGEIIPENFQ